MATADDQEQNLFREALRRANGPERDAFLDQACARNAALRARLTALLAAHERPDSFLEPPVAALPTTAPIESAPLEGPGTLIGRYKLLEKIGEGGFGAVYVAEQREPVKRRVALKIIKLGMDTRQVVARFEAERQALAMMDHPNIAQVFDAGATDTGRPYFVMELVRGVRITDYCDQNHLSTDERLKLFLQVCHAVQHAHQKGVIHRDIKPSNILVMLADDVPVPKMIDFGIAKAMGEQLTDKTVYTQFEQFIGTPAYMSPEQAGVSGLDVDTRSDIYALGVLLYELLTGKTPFDTRELLKVGLEEMLRTIREKEPPRPSTRLIKLAAEEQTTTAQRRATQGPKLIRSLRGDLDWIVMKCLEKDRTRRYETANELARDIERHLAHEPTLARPPSTGYRVQKFVQRNKLMVSAGALVAMALVLGVAASTWQAVRATRAGRRADQAARVAESQRARAEKGEQKAKEGEFATRQQAYAADMSLAQQALAMNDLGRARRLLAGHRPRPGEADLRGWEWRCLWQQCRSDTLGELCRHSNMVGEVAYAPDGKTLAVGGMFEEFVELWDVPGRRRTAALQTNTGRLVAFSPRGDLLVTDTVQEGTNVQGGINIWRAGTSKLVHQLSPMAPPWRAAARTVWSPSGARCLSQRRSIERGLRS